MVSPDVNFMEIDNWIHALNRAPRTVSKELSKALRASVRTMEKTMVDRNYRFYLPSEARTGHMAARKYTNITEGQAVIGHQVNYAERVYKLHRRRGDDFMSRFIREADPEITEHFAEALDIAVDNIADDT